MRVSEREKKHTHTQRRKAESTGTKCLAYIGKPSPGAGKVRVEGRVCQQHPVIGRD